MSRYVDSWKQWKKGDIVIRIPNVKDIWDSSMILEGHEYTVVNINPTGDQQLDVKGYNVTSGWWVAERIMMHKVNGVCHDCMNVCRENKKESCELKEIAK